MNSEKYLINGPYLLAPTSTQITIAWESEKPGNLNIFYTKKETNEVFNIKAVAKKEPGCSECSDGYYLYTATLTNLDEGTEYIYQIYQQNNLLCEGNFKTLDEKTNKIQLVTISDSHLFNTEKAFSSMIKHTKPDMILHSGDISFGTGCQHEQYVTNWFNKIPDILKQIPVYYVSGNHDDGTFYDVLFAQPQAKTVNTNDEGYTYSFDYGNTHFIMTNSNPWGLFEMNAINSGIEADSKTKQKIEKTLRWIDDDLKSKKAKEAKWRVLILHHPYTDAFNNRYIIPIAERNNVDLVISGHLHYYVKSVSINPDVGAKIVYISQGSLQEPEADFIDSKGNNRLLGDFPEVVGMGHSNYGVLEINQEKDELLYKIYGFTKDNTEILIDTIYMTHETPQLKIDEIELRRLDNNGHVEIRAHVKNCGTSIAAVKLQLLDNNKEHIINLFGNKDSSHVILLNAGEEQKISAIYTAKSQGEHIISVGNVSEKITVFEPTQLSFEHMKLFTGKGNNTNCLFASIEATNNLDREIFVSVPLYINQRIAESHNIFFRSHEKKSLKFCYKFEQAGSYQVSIADQLPKEIQIEGGIRIIPRIQDKSGNGHYALLHGTPKVIPKKDTIEINLDSYGDYIEIPASKDLIANESFCGMVWAQIDRLAKPNEMSHNPLMVRGKSVGWGATYFLRMVVERTGALKWGTCHDITEYQWQGGHAKIGKMSQYTISFDKQQGGNSYCDGILVAHVSGIDKNCKIRQWENEPIFIGYSYIGHVIPEINRPKYFTHLPAKISQVRFYKTNISNTENHNILESPTKAGFNKKDLAVWLDFKDILTVGTHTTQWRHPAVYDPSFKTEKKYWHFRQLKTKVILPFQANIKIIVEVSDDNATAKASLKFILKDGTNYIDLSELPKAQYIRIITELSAEVSSDGTFVPEVKEYQVTASNETDFTEMFWSTRTDWEKGIFTGAVGFAPIDRLRDYPEYTDIIHG